MSVLFFQGAKEMFGGRAERMFGGGSDQRKWKLDVHLNKQNLQMNKPSKHKNSNRTIKSSRNLTMKESILATSRTPQNNCKKLEIKHTLNLSKFKSIPTITHNDLENPQPNSMAMCQTDSTSPNQRVLTIHESEPQLLYSVSERHNYSVSKGSLHEKLRGSSKKTMATNKNINSRPETHRRNLTFEAFFERTKEVLDSYRVREEEWRKEKCLLIKELEKLKGKNKNRKNSSITSSKKCTKY